MPTTEKTGDLARIYARWGLLLKGFREKRGLTQTQFAKQLGVSRQAVSQWEMGDCAPNDAKRIEIADLLGIPVDALFHWGLTPSEKDVA